MPTLFGCARADKATTPASSAGSATQTSPGPSIVIGTMVTEDILPMWVAESEGMLANSGLDVSIQTFQSAQELSTALASGAIEMAMTDIMVSATLEASGTPVALRWVTLGTTPEQGRFGIMASPASGYTTLEQLAGVPIGVGSCTVPEYVMDKLMAAAGVSKDEIIGEEIKKVPVRYEMMVANQVAAAALPGSLLALGEVNGMILIADDRGAENLSQSVMIANADFSQSSEGAAALSLLGGIWNEAVRMINDDPEAFRGLLIEKAQLPEPVQATYPVNKYPLTELPSAAMVDPVLDWMFEKGYLSQELRYDPQTGTFSH
ncbi:MAG: ABC transporter substrate-binding protein [Coriobacteriales bacterium]|nr:ABC transporter substrate-binding protein [Coriobacteriales bacterium]